MGHAADGIGWPALDALVTEFVDAHRAVAVAQARESRLLAAAVDLAVARAEQLHADERLRPGADLPVREASAELGAAARLSDRVVQRRMGDAVAARDIYPAAFAAWEAGEIEAGHVDALLSAGAALPERLRERFATLALAVARAETVGRFRGIAHAIAAQLDPEGTAERIEARQDDRRVRVYDLDDGMARLLADLPAALAYAIHDRLTRMARTVARGQRETGDEAAEPEPEPEAPADDAESGDEPVVTGPRRTGSSGDGPHDTRTLDQLRADILCDLVLAGGPIAHGTGLDAVSGHVQVTVPVLALAGTERGTGMLAGDRPIDPVTARRLAGAATGWDRVMSDPYTGAVLAVDRYRPGADLHRFLRVRDERCRFPGCRRPARGCDVDHNLDAALGGPTRVHNLCHFCRRHHTLKHETAWRVRQRSGGVIEWTGPTGRTHRDRPPATVRFVPDDTGPPPF
ncbi:MAG: DUF222 domain-containing protein [Microbacterium sp.]|uniref:HNH endonuclease signature motif containing protein n=1 Tax=Microbacterium sp. TaxID=51671 RepID=UPI0039E613B4